MNIKCVYRSTLMGFDLNRAWHRISQWIHPTLHAAFTLITNLDQDKVKMYEATMM